MYFVNHLLHNPKPEGISTARMLARRKPGAKWNQSQPFCGGFARICANPKTYQAGPFPQLDLIRVCPRKSAANVL
jgi:hypothetical protein